MSSTTPLLESVNVRGCVRERDKERCRGENLGRKLRTFFIASALLLLPLVYFLDPFPPHTTPIWPIHHIIINNQTLPDHPGFLVWSPECKIPDIDPFSAESMNLFRPKQHISCSTGPPLVYMLQNDDGHNVLQINRSALKSIKIKIDNIYCCYINITRKDSDPKIIKSSCKPINESAVLLDTEEFVKTKCEIHGTKVKYRIKTHENVFLNVQTPENVKNRLDRFKNIYTNQGWNVLIIGIDTLSRINLMRAMPKTYNFLKTHNWLDFQGYNKIDDNTFPNIMAILTGRNGSRSKETCDGEGKYSPDNCNYMWKLYNDVGYVTAYAEDDVGIDTFEKPYHKGFVHKPTDHYLRPVFSIAEKSVHKPNKGSVFCTGQQTSGEVLFQYALNFIKKYKNDPYFGFFWANTFSHDNIGSPASMDTQVMEFFISLEQSGAINRTIIWFLSDHGVRYGNIRSTYSGYFEERLPAMYMHIPEQFKKEYNYFYQSLVTNTKRLTSPYDVFMTLQDILYISERREVIVSSEACPMCQSLFQPVPWNRSCQECSIYAHWCTCNPLMLIPSNHSVAVRATNYIVDTIIEDVLKAVNTEKCRKCAKLSVKKIISVYTYNYPRKSTVTDDYLLVFSVKPGKIIFEATIRHSHETDSFSVQGIVSRLTEYRGSGNCVPTAYLKKYCQCLHIC